jgi:hypothetical protein
MPVGQLASIRRKLIGEAIPMHLEMMREVGEPIPEPHHLAGSVTA